MLARPRSTIREPRPIMAMHRVLGRRGGGGRGVRYPGQRVHGGLWLDQLNVNGVGMCGERFEVSLIAGEDGAAGFGECDQQRVDG